MKWIISCRISTSARITLMETTNSELLIKIFMGMFNKGGQLSINFLRENIHDNGLGVVGGLQCLSQNQLPFWSQKWLKGQTFSLRTLERSRHHCSVLYSEWHSTTRLFPPFMPPSCHFYYPDNKNAMQSHSILKDTFH